MGVGEKLDSSITGVPLIPDRKARAFEWKVENFLSFKGLMETQKIFSKYFQIGECEFRIGFRKSLDALCAYMECDPSVVNDPDKNFWVSYSLTLVNQKSPDRNVLAKASFFTRIGNSSVEFMKVSDMLKAHGGFLVRETVVFLGEILDCCPWFEFSSLEVLACDNDQDALLTDPVNIINSKDKVFNGDVKEFFGILLARAGFCPGGSSLQPQFPTEILVDAGRIDTFLKDINAYLNDPLGPKHFLPSTLPYGSNDGKQQATTADGSSMTLTEVKLWLKVLQQAIVDELLDIMVDCCQPSDRKSNDPCNGNEAMNQSEYNGENGVADCVQSPIFARVGSRMDETINSYTEKCFDMITTDLPEEATPGLAISSPEMTADVPVVFCCIKNSKIKRSEQAEDILGLIFNYLKACPDPQGCPEVTQRPQSAQNISFILNEAPRHLLPDLVTLVPKLVDHSKLPVAACMLLDQLKKPNVEPALHPLVLDAVSQMDFGNEVWEQVILKALELLMNSNDESLDRTISFLFKAASQCGHITLVVQVVQVSLRRFGDHISPRALDYLCKTVNNCSDIAITMLKKINFAFGLNDKCLKNCSFPLWYGENEMLSKRMNLEDEQQLHANCHFSDIYILIEMLSIPSLAVEASQTFEKAFAQGLIDEHLMEMVLARRQAQLLTVDYMSFSEKYSHKDIVVEGKVKSVPVEEVDSTLVLGLAEKFAFSDDPNVHESGIMLYAMLYKLFSGEDYRRRMLKGLVDRATSLTENNFEVDTVLDILVSLVNTGQVVAEVVLQMMREVVEQANVDCATYRHQLRASEDEKIHIREEKLAELSNIVRETAILFERISDSEISIDLLKSEMVHKMEHFALERTEILEQLQEVENQLGRLYSKSDGVIAKLSNEKKNYEDRLNDLETQLSQLKSQTSDELKIAVTEKNALSAMLESVESGTRRFDEELKCYAANAQILVEAQNSLEGEVEQLKEKHEQIESEKREKQELVMKYTTHIHNLDASLNSYQQRIQALEAELEVEKSQHAPLYGYGLEALSAKELETVSRIHVEGLRDIHAFIQRRYGIGSSSINPNTHPNPLMVCPTATTPMAVGLPYLPTSNGSQIHDIGGIVSQWDPGSCARKFFRHDHRDP
ncbi:uncharacterized protein LOC131157650 [Malania oleifera]|uniref:uncharacterized protein LOC131157650 n=1 Tax=Malania oleifera TaxID=397392 RepID=UPI0025ADF566|nr:uncharacterized protein LOC131157650 [Malania oleifera]